MNYMFSLDVKFENEVMIRRKCLQNLVATISSRLDLFVSEFVIIKVLVDCNQCSKSKQSNGGNSLATLIS